METLRRIGSLFLAPAAEPDGAGEGRAGRAASPPAGAQAAAPAAPAETRAGPTGLLAPAGEARCIGAALALATAGRGVGVVAAWGCAGGRPGAAPSAATARRLVASLGARGLEATASGRLVSVALEGDERAAASAFGRLEAACAGSALVLALGGPRGRWLDEVLARCSTVHVHAGTAAVTELTVARLLEQGVRAEALGAPPTGVARRLAGSGLVLPGTARWLRPGAVGEVPS